jgi:mono/diheme cytochrome c family protein
MTFVLAASLVALGNERQQPPQPPQRLAIESMYGRDLYEFYCAGCHGREARGGARVLRMTQPPDLTHLAIRNGGVWPRARLEAFVAGDDPHVRRPGEMPTWGPIFRALDPDEAATHVRIANIVAYLETMQVKYAVH